MPRRRVAAKREILADPKYGSVLLTKFINVLMVDGKKSIAEKVVYGALERLENDFDKSKIRDHSSDRKTVNDAVDMFQLAINKVKPGVEVRSRRVGGATYQIPCEVKVNRGTALAMRWIVQASRSRSEKGMMLRLSYELQDILQDRGVSVKKREDVHRMAEANKAFAHFRWN